MLTPKLRQAATTAVLSAVLFVVALGLLHLLGVTFRDGWLSAAVSGAVAGLINEYRSSEGSMARQRANRDRHRAASPLWQPTENDNPQGR